MDRSRLNELEKMFDQLDGIRKELVAYKDQHIKTLTGLGMSRPKAVKDWQDNFKNIINSMDYCSKEIRKYFRNNNR